MKTSSASGFAPRGSRVAWIYGGVWGVLARWFKVPEEPPELPSVDGEASQTFRPAPAFLRYLLLQSLLGGLVLGLIGFGVMVAVAIGLAENEGAIVVILLALAAWVGVFVLWIVVIVLAVHLRYDTTWYVLSDRSLRIRRGIWVIRETTITFENIQNVTVRQGPLQRIFGIADVLVDTAGGGGGAHQQQGGAAPAHQGLVEGIADAPTIRDLLTAKMRASKSAGLGDEAGKELRRSNVGWTAEQLAALREVRDAAVALTSVAR